MLCDCGQLNVRARSVVWLWIVDGVGTDGVLCDCRQLNVRAQTVRFVVVTVE